MKSNTPKFSLLSFLFLSVLLCYSNIATAQNSIVVDEVVGVSCPGQNDGWIYVTALPSGTYTYNLDGGIFSNTSGDFFPVSSGTHTVCASNGSTTFCETIFVPEPDPFDIVFTTDQAVSCHGNDGILSVNISGGTNLLIGYITWWTNALGDTVNDGFSNPFATYLDGLNSGTYNVAIQDDNGCHFNQTGYLEQADPIIVTATYNPTLCYGSTTSIVPSSTGGVLSSPLIYEINGQPIAPSYPGGTYTITATDMQGCVGSIIVNIIELAPDITINTITACDSYTWNGVTLSMSGVYTHTSLNASGCINTATLILTINYSSLDNNATITECDSYIWNGATYTTSGVYTYTSLNAEDCVNTATLTLTINYSTSSTSSATVCDYYTWHGTTYTTSGTYTYISLNAAGCAHIATLNLTINNSTFNGDATVTACDFYTWNGTTYTMSGVYTHTSLNASGCINTATLTLTINNSSNDVATTTQCNAYIWNGATYTMSGVYTYTSLNASGCMNTDNLYLTINYSSSSTTNITACNSYTWTNGFTYTAAGTYSYTTLNSFGCDSILTLHLTLNNGVHISPKVFLQGAYIPADGMMNDILRSSTTLGDPTGAIPIPYLIPPHIPNTPTHFLPSMGATIGAGVLAVFGANAIVDWVYVEIRDGSNNNIVISSQHALVQRDGNVVSTDGVSDLYFHTICPGNYYISIKHRNHLGVMTSSTFDLSSQSQLIDFTATGSVWNKPGVLNAARVQVNPGVYALWSGDALNNNNAKYNGSSNDKLPILNAVLGSVPPGFPFPPSANTTYGYRNEDLNMDGKVRYLNNDNDRDFLLAIVQIASSISSSNDVISQHTPN